MNDDQVLYVYGDRGEEIARRAEELLDGEPDRGDIDPDDGYFDRYFAGLRILDELMPTGGYTAFASVYDELAAKTDRKIFGGGS